MSDAVIISLITSIATLVGLVITGVLNARSAARIERRSTAIEKKVEMNGEKIEKKVEEYHKEVNGKMGILLETTKALGNAEGKAEQLGRDSKS